MNQNVANWLMNGERGASSEVMVSAFEFIRIPIGWCTSHPHDSSDFDRCVKLLDAVPEYRTRLDEMRTVSPQWETLVEHWAELEDLLAESAPKLYDRMKELGC